MGRGGHGRDARVGSSLAAAVLRRRALLPESGYVGLVRDALATVADVGGTGSSGSDTTAARGAGDSTFRATHTRGGRSSGTDAHPSTSGGSTDCATSRRADGGAASSGTERSWDTHRTAGGAAAHDTDIAANGSWCPSADIAF